MAVFGGGIIRIVIPWASVLVQILEAIQMAGLGGPAARIWDIRARANTSCTARRLHHDYQESSPSRSTLHVDDRVRLPRLRFPVPMPSFFLFTSVRPSRPFVRSFVALSVDPSRLVVTNERRKQAVETSKKEVRFFQTSVLRF
jgi:hypothetical protein